MSQVSSSRRFSVIDHLTSFFRGTAVGFLPLLLFLLVFVYVYPVYPRHLLLQHIHFDLCITAATLPPSASSFALWGLVALCLYLVEGVSVVIILLVNPFVWKSGKLGFFALWMLLALVADFFAFWQILVYVIGNCSSWQF